MENCVIFTEILTPNGLRFGRATLNAPKSLNALSLAMIERLGPQLQHWATQQDIVGVMIDGNGDKAFCAGGDVAAMYHAIRKAGRQTPAPELCAFFEKEYRLDYNIHTYPKPVLCWGNGIVMGGGIGLLAGSSHRVVTESTRMAMPEITIGLYPDVGASWFLPRMPGKLGLFLTLTGAPLNATDAHFAKLADFSIAHQDRDQVIDAISNTRWYAPEQPTTPGAHNNHHKLSQLLSSFKLAQDIPAVAQSHVDTIDTIIGQDDLLSIAERLTAHLNHSDKWLATAAKTFNNGAPSTAQLGWALWHKTKHASLADVLRTEYIVSVACGCHPDFPEGVRALLIDKDRTPRWQHAHLSDVTQRFVDDHFVPRFSGAHPLADLQ